MRRRSRSLTLCVVALLVGLHGLADLHANDVDFGFTVLQHLLGRLKHFLILQQWKHRRHTGGLNIPPKKDF